MIQNRTPILAMALLLLASFLPALSLEPLSQTFGLSLEGRVRTFRVTNTQSEPIAVRVRMASRTIDENGVEQQADASSQFLVFPAQIALQPGASQAVRVQYTGPAGAQAERAYRIIVEQLPVSFDDEAPQTSGIRLMFRYVGSVYVRPDDAAPDIILASVERAFENDEFAGVRVRFENRGTAHAIFDDLVITLRLLDANGRELDEIVLNEDQLEIVGGANILAGSALQEVIVVPQSWASGTLDVTYDAGLIE